MKIDCHTHLDGTGNINAEMMPKYAQDLVEAMDESGVDISFVISNHFNTFKGWISVEEALQKAREFPERLRVIAHVDFLRLEEEKYIEELKQFLSEREVVGLKFYLGYQEVDLDDEQLVPLYRVCEELGLPIVVHTGYLLVDTPGNEEAAHPRAVARAADKYPNNHFVAAHFGNPWVKDCGRILAEKGNVYADLSGYFTEYQPISSEEKELFSKDIAILKTAGVKTEKLLFGTDWPLYSQQEYVKAVEEVGFSYTELKAVFEENVRRVFPI